MSISMYQASVPYFLQLLGNLRKILEKGAKHAEAKKFDTMVLFNARLAPDMLPLVKQIQIASDNAKGPAARLAGIEARLPGDGLVAALKPVVEGAAEAVRPPADGWRAHPPYRGLTAAFLADPLGALPHYPLVTHRGGFPDGS